MYEYDCRDVRGYNNSLVPNYRRPNFPTMSTECGLSIRTEVVVFALDSNLLPYVLAKFEIPPE